jgi:hypothetical protein
MIGQGGDYSGEAQRKIFCAEHTAQDFLVKQGAANSGMFGIA